MKVSQPLKSCGLDDMLSSMDPHVDASKHPRVTFPVSFLNTRSFLYAVGLFLLASTSSSVATPPHNPYCVCEYDADRDYFPVKLNAQYANGFNIEYHKSYKKLTVQTSAGPFVTIAYLCGTPQPAGVVANTTIRIPIDSIAIESTTFLPFIRYIGKENSLFFANTDALELPACQRNRSVQNKLSTGWSLSAVAAAVTNNSLVFTNEDLDLVLLDTYGYSGALTTIQNDFTSHTKAIEAPQAFEKHPLGPIDWLKPIAALYNAEAQAEYVVSSINARYECLKTLVAEEVPPNTPKKKVVWGNYNKFAWDPTPSYSGAVCPNYYCQMIEDAGAELIAFPNGSPNVTEFAAAVAQADIFIYVDGNFNQSTAYQAPFMEAADIALFTSAPPFVNKQIYDIRGGHFSGDWFEDRIAEPDVLLIDLVQIIQTGIVSGTRAKRFLRNVFTEDANDQTSRDPSKCKEDDSPYQSWLEGICDQGAIGENAGDTVVCLPDGATWAPTPSGRRLRDNA